jgi:hypothetical protein
LGDGISTVHGSNRRVDDTLLLLLAPFEVADGVAALEVALAKTGKKKKVTTMRTETHESRGRLLVGGTGNGMDGGGREGNSQENDDDGRLGKHFFVLVRLVSNQVNVSGVKGPVAMKDRKVDEQKTDNQVGGV